MRLKTGIPPAVHGGHHRTGESAATRRVIVITGLEVSDEDGESGGSGFDVEVGDWGDRHEYELPV